MRELLRKEHGAHGPKLFHQIAMHPAKHMDVALEIPDDFVVLDDLYPKAKKPILVLSKSPGLGSHADVWKEHLPFLKAMHSLIHMCNILWVPSMRQLHLHVISQDFNSPHLKNKKHWNSFNTYFFRDSTNVIEEVEEHGEATSNEDEKLLSMELRCHRCKSAHPNIPG